MLFTLWDLYLVPFASPQMRRGLRGDFNVLMMRNKNIVGRFISKQVVFVNLILKKYFRFKNKAPLHKYALNKFSRQQDFYTLAEVGTFER